jgi:hypothetical protein
MSGSSISRSPGINTTAVVPPYAEFFSVTRTP